MCLQNARCATLIVFGRLVTKLASLTENLVPPDVLFHSKMNVTDCRVVNILIDICRDSLFFFIGMLST